MVFRGAAAVIHAAAAQEYVVVEISLLASHMQAIKDI